MNRLRISVKQQGKPELNRAFGKIFRPISRLFVHRVSFGSASLNPKSVASGIDEAARDAYLSANLYTPMLVEAPIELIDEARSGLTGRRAEDLATRLSLTDKELARLLSLSIRTFHRIGLEGKLDAVASERLLLLEQLARHGESVFEDLGVFARWLRRPLRVLSGHAPLDLMDTSTGLTLVDTILGRIEYGVYS